jgi:hypothetical protein
MTKRILTAIVLLSAVASCHTKAASETKQADVRSVVNKDSIDEFWDWFVSEEKTLRSFQNDPDKIVGQVMDRARKIKDGIAIEFEPPKNNIINVTVSADGNRDLFPLVQRIVEKAPKIDGWTFVAFRQRVPKDIVKGFTLKLQGVELHPDKMKFFPMPSGDSLDVIIYANNVTEENYNQVAYGSLLLVDNILGEYDCVKKVRKYDIHNMPTSKEELNGLMPLVDLAEYVDNFHKSIHH